MSWKFQEVLVRNDGMRPYYHTLKSPPPLSPKHLPIKNPYISSYKRYIRITSQLDSLSENAFIPKVHKYYLGDPT